MRRRWPRDCRDYRPLDLHVLWFVPVNMLAGGAGKAPTGMLSNKVVLPIVVCGEPTAGTFEWLLPLDVRGRGFIGEL